MITFFNIHGAMVYVDEAGEVTGYEDVFTKIAMCRTPLRRERPRRGLRRPVRALGSPEGRAFALCHHPGRDAGRGNPAAGIVPLRTPRSPPRLVEPSTNARHDRARRMMRMSPHEPLRLHVPEPTGRPGCADRLLLPAPVARRRGAPPAGRRRAGRHQRPGLRAGARARRRRPRRRPLGAAGRRRSCCARGLRAMMKTRIFDARMLIAQRQKKISFYMQCLGEEAIATAHALALAAGRHVLSDLSPAGPAAGARRRARWSR